MRVHLLCAALAAAVLAGCSDGSSRSPLAPPGGPPRFNHVGSVTVCCDVTLYVGATTQLHATLRDGSGRMLTGEPIGWQSYQPSIASMDSDFGPTATVRARSVGYATIEARSGGVVGTATVRVIAAPVATRVEVTPDPVAVEVGGTVQLSARVYDQYGNLMTGKAPAWSVANPSIATIGSGGALTGVAAGSTTVTATVDGVSDRAPVTVEPPFSLSISGPDIIWTEGTYTWEAMPTGGNGTYTYSWTVEYPYTGSGTGQAQPAGNGTTLSLPVTGSTGYLVLTVDVTSGTQLRSASMFVCNFIEGLYC
jgi:Big-like domain-containing protein